ncbi:MAG: outer membrane beta-barrel protein [Pseudomonadota bacterium]|nr:outer membrane beta-barrel protein [Pseudomonadota bacterium]
MKHSKKISALCVASLTALLAMSAHAATYSDSKWGNWYAGISGDLTWMNHTNTGGGGNVDLGYRFWTGTTGDLRLEGELGYHGASNSGDFTGNTHYFSYLANAYYDLNNFRPWEGGPWSGSGWHLVPYVGAGLGDATVHSGHNASLSNQSFNFRGNVNSFAYDFMAGLTLVSDAMPNTDWSLGYRYFGTTKATDDSGKIHSNNLELGLRFHF